MTDSALKQVFAAFTFDAETGELRKIEAEVGKTAAAIDKTVKGSTGKATGLLAGLDALGAGLTGILAGVGLVHFTNELSETLDELDDLSAQTGATVRQLQELDYFATVNGSSAAEMRDAVSKLQIALGRAATDGKAQTQALKEMGVAFDASADKTRPMSELLPEILDNFSNIKDEGKQAAAAQALFGRAGVKLLPLLKQGKDGIAKLREEFDALGGGATQEATEAAGAYRDSLARLDLAMFSLKARIGSAVFPQLEKVVGATAKLIANFSGWAKNTTLVEHGVAALAGTVALKLGAALAPYLIPGLKFAAIFLAIDDLLAFLEGKDSIIGDLLNRAFGDGTAGKVRAWLQDVKAIWVKAWNDMRSDPDGLIAHFGKPETWQPIVDAVAEAFGGLMKAVWKRIWKRIGTSVFGAEKDDGAPVVQGDIEGQEPQGFLAKTLDFVVPGFAESRRKNTEEIDRQARASISKRSQALGLATSVEAAHPFAGPALRADEAAQERAATDTHAVDRFAESLTALVGASKRRDAGAGIDPALGVAPPRAVVPLRTEAPVNYVEINQPIIQQIAPGTPRQQTADIAAAAKTGASRANLAALERTK